MDFCDLLTRMLKFNPDKRITAKECLSHKLFEKIRSEKVEIEAPFKITVHDQYSEGFDYMECKDLLSFD